MDKPALRGGAGPLVHLIAPVRTSVEAGRIPFRWQSQAGAEYYRLEIFDDAFRLVWRSGSVRSTALDLVAGPGLKIVAGESYFWRVTAVTADRIETPSRLGKFTVRR